MSFRSFLTAAAFALGVGATSQANALPITYNLVFDQLVGNVGDSSGVLVIDSPSWKPDGLFDTVPGGFFNDIISLTLNVDGHVFSLDNDTPPLTTAYFSNGDLLSLTYVGSTGSRVSLTTGLDGYLYVSTASGVRYSAGSISAAVPTPGTIGIRGLGLGILGLMTWQHRRSLGAVRSQPLPLGAGVLNA